MSKRTLNLLTALDQFMFCLVTLGSSDPDETASAAAWRLENTGKLQGKLFRPALDTLFFFDTDHCKRSFESEYLRSQLPKEYR